MAGLGFKDFAVGEVLTSADVDGYLMQQTVMRFADAGARGSALGTAAGTGIALAEGMVSYLDDVNDVQVYNGLGWVSAMAVKQIVSTTKSDTFTTTSTSFVDITGLSVTITPSSATNKIMLLLTLNTDIGAAAAKFGDVTRDGTPVGVGDASSSRRQAGWQNTAAAADDPVPIAWSFLDSPSTTSAVTYQARFAVSTSTGYINRTAVDADSSAASRTISTLTAFEVIA